MEKEVIIKERVEKNLQVLKLLAKDDINISEKERTEILKGPVLRMRAFGTLGLKIVSIWSAEKHNVDTLYIFNGRNQLQ